MREELKKEREGGREGKEEIREAVKVGTERKEG